MPSTTDSSPGREKVPFLDLRRQFEAIEDEMSEAMRTVLESCAFVGGPQCRDFEEAFARYLDVPSCVGVANGTDAIEIALEALDLPPGGEVIVPANSFIASSEAVSRSGLRVVFADVDAEHMVLDPADVEARVTSRTVALLPVHLYGHPAPMAELADVARRHGLTLVEDAAQAHGAEYRGRRVGGLGVVATFSFYPGKNLGAYGDAGALVTTDGPLADRMRKLANHGRAAKYEHDFEGRNSRLDGLQAAVLAVKLRHLDGWNRHRRALAEQYRHGLAGVGDLILPVEAPDCFHVYHLFVVRTGKREELRDWLEKDGIATGIHYPVALPRLQAYRSHPQHDEPFRAVDFASQLLSLPMGDSLTPGQIDRVVGSVRAFFGA